LTGVNLSLFGSLSSINESITHDGGDGGDGGGGDDNILNVLQ
jgi:hypothetical protein